MPSHDALAGAAAAFARGLADAPADGAPLARHRELLGFSVRRAALRAGAPAELFSPSPCPSLDAARIDRGALREGDALLADLDASPAALAAAYERSLAPAPRAGARAPAANARRASGAYYTPDALVDALLDLALEPAVAEALAARPGDPAAAVLSLAVVDPACGAGAFLVAAGRRLAAHLARVAPSLTPDEALRAVASRCLHGVDRDPVAVALCRLALWRDGAPPASLAARVVCGDALLGAPRTFLDEGVPDAAWATLEGDDPAVASALRARNRRERASPSPPSPRRPAVDAARERRLADLWCAAFAWPRRPGALASAPTHGDWGRALAGGALPARAERVARELAEAHRFVHWHLAFPEAFARGGFDVVLGNPPFLNAIEGGVRPPLPHLHRHLAPELGGTADVAHRMLALADRVRRPGGRVGMVQPRAALNAPAMARWRRARSPGRVAALLALEDGGLFPGAQVFVALVALADAPLCRVAVGRSPVGVVWAERAADSDNWWALVTGAAASSRVGAPLRERFAVTASMTAREAYALAPFVVDRADGEGPRLVTTGLIEPGALRWGEARCRYLGRDYRHPRVAAGRELPTSVARRMAAARRPKLLVAGLSARVECYLDETGDCVGAVSTYSVVHPADDVDALRGLMGQLHAPEAHERFRAELGGGALAGGNVTMRKAWLEDFGVR